MSVLFNFQRYEMSTSPPWDIAIALSAISQIIVVNGSCGKGIELLIRFSKNTYYNCLIGEINVSIDNFCACFSFITIHQHNHHQSQLLEAYCLFRVIILCGLQQEYNICENVVSSEIPSDCETISISCITCVCSV